jgi:hypothetical protein
MEIPVSCSRSISDFGYLESRIFEGKLAVQLEYLAGI